MEEKISVVRGLQKAMIGRPAIETLGLVTRLNAINSQEKVTAKYPDLFTGLGTLEGEYRIKLKEDAKPFASSHDLQEGCTAAFAQGEGGAGVDGRSGSYHPSKQANRMVFGYGHCTQILTRLTESVCRERHILPSVEHILAQLRGAKVFTKLDANSGFWQIKLSEESSRLTTFLTPFGRFRFNRLPFGITSAPEHFQRRMSDILTGLEGTLCMIDNVLVYGSSQEEHDCRLSAVLERIQQAGSHSTEKSVNSAQTESISSARW